MIGQLRHVLTQCFLRESLPTLTGSSQTTSVQSIGQVADPVLAAGELKDKLLAQQAQMISVTPQKALEVVQRMSHPNLQPSVAQAAQIDIVIALLTGKAQTSLEHAIDLKLLTNAGGDH